VTPKIHNWATTTREAANSQSGRGWPVVITKLQCIASSTGYLWQYLISWRSKLAHSDCHYTRCKGVPNNIPTRQIYYLLLSIRIISMNKTRKWGINKLLAITTMQRTWTLTKKSLLYLQNWASSMQGSEPVLEKKIRGEAFFAPFYFLFDPSRLHFPLQI